jgi:DNA-binding NtrC family response regulator
MAAILVIDPSEGFRENDAIVERNAEAGFRRLKTQDFSILVIMSGEIGIARDSFIRRALAKSPLMGVILVGEPFAKENIAGHLVDIELPSDVSHERLRAEIERLAETLRLQQECDLVGKSAELKAITELIFRVAPTDLPVLIIGESGTGKELVARAIHRHSGRFHKPFLAVNSAAIPEGTLESELFGHEKGSFTGAISRHEGYFEQANGGTIFLDEIGELPQSTQSKLLRVLETGDIIRVGGKGSVHSNVRLIAATNIDLTEAVVARRFREDLYYRLSAVKINIPPLRQRRRDIPTLVNKFVSEVEKSHSGDFGGFSNSAVSAMMEYHWPGNVRELKNLVENALLLAGERIVKAEDLESYFFDHQRIGRDLPMLAHKGRFYEQIHNDKDRIEAVLSLIYTELKRLEARIEELADRLEPIRPLSSEEAEEMSLRKTLSENGFDKNVAAKRLGISLRTLYRRMKKYGID